jgi:uncharacterized protein (TIGR02678 family)
VSKLQNQLATDERDDVARAIRTLLRHPLLTAAADPAGFDLVRKRRDVVVNWFDFTLGWKLVVEARLGYARLFKVRDYGDGAATSRPAARQRGDRRVWDRRRYVLFCVVCAELVSRPGVNRGIGELADQVVRASHTDPELPEFDPASLSERRAFVDVLLQLEAFGALLLTDGATEAFVDSSSARVLYRVQSNVLLRLLSSPVAPSVVDSGAPGDHDAFVEGLLAERRYAAGDEETAQPSNLWLRHSALRRVFDDPVVYRCDLTDAQLGYLTSITGRKLLHEAAEQAGFELEERAEGWLLIDPSNIATNEKFPDPTGTAQAASLLLLDKLAEAGEDGITEHDAAAWAEALLEATPKWAASYRSDDGPQRLAADAAHKLRVFGLIRSDDGRLVPLPAAARYRATHTTIAPVLRQRTHENKDQSSEQLSLGD